MTKRHIPNHITATQLIQRLAELRDLLTSNLGGDAESLREAIFADVLHTIAFAPAMANKTELRRIAALGLEAHHLGSQG